MEKLQVIIVGLALLATLGSAATSVLSHNEAWGARSQRDVLLSRETIREQGKGLRVVSHAYEFHQKADKNFPEGRTITQIVVSDLYANGNGGYARLTAGGPSTDFAKIHLRSQRGHGLHFTIDIYGQ